MVTEKSLVMVGGAGRAQGNCDHIHPLLQGPVPTPINVRRFAKLLKGYDQVKYDYLIDGLTNGFHLEITEGSQFLSQSDLPPTHNHQSALRNFEAIDTKIQNELQAGRLLGPFTSPPFDNYMVSPLGAAEKKTPGDYRPIHDLSCPQGSSVNDAIPIENGHVYYQTLDQVIDSIVQLGPGTAMIKSDLENAYKILPIHPNDVPKMGIYWNGLYYFDRTLAMGCRTSAKIFEAFSNGLEWILKHKFKIDPTHHILDDFFMLKQPPILAPKALGIYLAVCNYLLVPVKMSKTEMGQLVPFVGIELDTIEMEARLPPDKLVKCKAKIQDVISKDTVPQVQLASLAGLLNFACRVVRPGRAFLRRLYDVIALVPNKYHHIKVHAAMKADLELWLKFLNNYNGVTMFHEPGLFTAEGLHCYTDAAKAGFGIVFGSHWAYGSFPERWAKYNICMLEAYPIMVVFYLFAPLLANKRVTLHTDNEALVRVLNKQTSKHPGTMVMVRHIVLQAMLHNIIFRALHIPGLENVLSDPLSRLQPDLFKSRAIELGKEMDADPTRVPDWLTPQLFPIT